MSDLESLEAVYYARPYPEWLSLTTLACIFDRLHFPGVYMPRDFDQLDAYKEVQRLGSIPSLTLEDIQAQRALEFALHRHHFDDFCVFTATPQTAGEVEAGTGEVAHALEEEIYGPSPESFIRTVIPRWSKNVPGGDSIGAPGSLFYPASAFLYGCRNGLPVVNDDGMLPVPSTGNAKNNTKALAAIMAVECVRLVLPSVPPVLHPRDIGEMRSELRAHLRPFRLALLRLAGELNGLITADASPRDVQAAARVLAETKVYPELQGLRDEIERASKPYFKRAIGVFKTAPELAQAFSTMSPSLAVARVLGKLLGGLESIADDQNKREHLKRSGLYYLLRLPEVLKSE
jgi:hypothetical protein